MRILLTGATGYVGGRLLSALESQHRRVRCLVRDPRRLTLKPGELTEVARGDLQDSESLDAAMRGIDTAYYLVHSMSEGADFEERERLTARNFGEAAKRAGVKRIIYLGALAHGPALSPHLKSRQEVGAVLRSSGAQVIEFRASIVLGAGSVSFELIRTLVERLPVMITPRWVSVKAQPISISDLLQYLIAALDLDVETHRIFEIGGADQVSYGDLMREYASQRGLRRTMVRAPVLTPRLSSLWLALVTPLYARIGRRLIDSIRYPTVVEDHSAREVFSIRPCGMSHAIREALEDEDRQYLTGSLDSMPRRRRHVDACETQSPAKPDAVFEGIMEMARGKEWTVEVRERPRRCVLRFEGRLPGRAWLHVEVMPSVGGSVIRQRLVFDPLGVMGRVFWYGSMPFHGRLFERITKRVTSFSDAA